MKLEARGIQSVDVGGRLLEGLVRAASPLMLRDLAASADVTPAQAHVYLTSFKKLGLVDQDRGSGLYRIGPFAMRLAMARLHSDSLLQKGADAASQLCRELGVSVTMTVWGCGAPTVILVQDGPEEINVNLRPGRVYSITTTATGKLFAAYLRNSEVEKRIVDEIRASSDHEDAIVSALSKYRHSVSEVKRLGFAVADRVPIPGIVGLAAPVFDHEGGMQYALTLVGRDTSLDIDPQGRSLTTLRAKTREITEGTQRPQSVLALV